mmetsp:Transcript_10843/g.25389  ORF Transcript_10843/g.25389 Transcript_10843/m.25389 type:complete len:238 (+) Transcript_10843:316-1029(+)
MHVCIGPRHTFKEHPLTTSRWIKLEHCDSTRWSHHSTSSSTRRCVSEIGPRPNHTLVCCSSCSQHVTRCRRVLNPQFIVEPRICRHKFLLSMLREGPSCGVPSPARPPTSVSFHSRCFTVPLAIAPSSLSPDVPAVFQSTMYRRLATKQRCCCHQASPLRWLACWIAEQDSQRCNSSSSRNHIPSSNSTHLPSFCRFFWAQYIAEFVESSIPVCLKFRVAIQSVALLLCRWGSTQCV